MKGESLASFEKKICKVDLWAQTPPFAFSGRELVQRAWDEHAGSSSTGHEKAILQSEVKEIHDSH